MRANPKLDVETAITELSVGEALVSLLDEKGRPSMVERAFVVPPASRIGPLSDAERDAAIKASTIYGHYEKTIDRESAYEKLKDRTAARRSAMLALRDDQVNAPPNRDSKHGEQANQETSGNGGNQR